ncbi:rhomboid family intramembrane serine protease [Marinomonas algicola]|uniref:rhomboid family intramembrane serine protease n=1 Tax=Marinomonas algicola TaxID=2773454 RepID=UPI00174D5608|nr:rhomboid family intramembrane serine protease [Marinomonas algicola]
MKKYISPNNTHFLLLIIGLIFLFILCAPYSNEWKSVLILNLSKPEQVWRLITAHFTHWSWPHLIVNAFGLLLFHLLFKNEVGSNPSETNSTKEHQALNVKSIVTALIFILLMSNFYIFFAYSYEFYLGFSSILYGLYSYCAVRCLAVDKVTNGFILLAIFLQIQPWFAVYNSSTLIGLTVATDVHTAATTSGLVLAGYHTVKQCFTKRI